MGGAATGQGAASSAPTPGRGRPGRAQQAAPLHRPGGLWPRAGTRPAPTPPLLGAPPARPLLRGRRLRPGGRGCRRSDGAGLAGLVASVRLAARRAARRGPRRPAPGRTGCRRTARASRRSCRSRRAPSILAGWGARHKRVTAMR